MTNGQPVLWHLPTSHFSEKVRWALEYKRVAHTRRLPRAVPHFVVARHLTDGAVATFPVLELEGRAIGDSTRIIAALEERHPEPPLYPADAAQRKRALAIEDWFDENLGRDIRVIALGSVLADPPRLAQLAAAHMPASFRPLPGLWTRLFGATLSRRYRLARPGAIERARRGVAHAFDRLEQELDGREYLVGDGFTIADLAAASHFYWLLQPEEGPRVVDRLPAPLAEFMTGLEHRDGSRWVREMYRRHRRAAPAGRGVPAGTPPLVAAG